MTDDNEGKRPNQITSCLIWGDDYQASVRYLPHNQTYHVHESHRSGGGYMISKEVLKSSVRHMTDNEKARLTTWVVDQRSLGVANPVVTSAIVHQAKNAPPLSVRQRADRLLRFIAGMAETVGDRIEVQPSTLAAYAWSESVTWEDVVYFLNYLETNDWIQGPKAGNGAFFGTVTVVGYSRIEEQATNVDSSQAFLAMWLDQSMSGAFEEGFKPAIESAGYKPLRIDQKDHVNKIDDEIIAELRRSRFVIADFTQGKDGARGGVYYEAGFAQGMNLPVIFTCHQDCLDSLHFDTRQYNHIVWTTREDLRKKLKTRILAVIGEGTDALKNP